MQAAARADFCRFLSACYYEPAPQFAEEKLFDSMVAVATELDPGLAAQAQHLREDFQTEPLEELLIDYTRLFLGPNGALVQPYASVWLSGEKTLVHDSTMRLLELYGEGGFAVAEDFRESPDHIAAELEFLYLLIYRERQATADGNDARRAELAHLREKLRTEHLGRWAGRFAAAMKNAAQSGFYRELADLTQRFVALEFRQA